MSDVTMDMLMGSSLKSVVASSQSTTCARLILAGVIQSGVSADQICTAFHAARKTVEEKDRGDTVEKITGGCVITSNTAVLGFFECKDSLICSLLGEIEQRGVLGGTRILSVTQECPLRAFSNWGVYSANPPSSDVDVSAEGATNVALDILTSVSSCSDLSSSSSSTIIGLSKSVQLPSSNALVACTKSSDFATSAEYVELFGGQVHVDAASEAAWPLQPFVVYK